MQNPKPSGTPSVISAVCRNGFRASNNVHRGNVVGDTRQIRTADDKIIVERLEKLDNENRIFSYSILASPFPLKDYVVTITVGGSGENTSVTWECSCEADGAPEEDVQKLVNSIVQGGLKSLKSHCELDSTTTSLKKLKPE